MKKYLVAILMVSGYAAFSQTTNYENAWKSLNENNRAEAQKFLELAMKNPSMYADAYMTDLYVKTYNRKENEAKDFVSSFYKKVDDPYPYIYAQPRLVPV